jgi:hypothetical protein
LAACAATIPQTDLSTNATSPTYLQGISSRYSLRLDEINSSGSQNRAKQLPGGLAAGDESLTFCAALFKDGDSFGLDMVLQNHGLEPFDLYRANIVVRDNAGRRLEPIHGFAGAELYGLRGRTTARLAQGTIPGTRSSSTLAAQRPATEAPSLTGSKRIAGMEGVGVPVETTPGPSLDFVGSVQTEVPNPELPDVVDVPPGKSRVYWSYWTGEEVEYPLFVTVSVNDRRLLLKFQAPAK